MATSAAILAVVRAAAPACRSRADQLAFAVHAAVLASGYRLVGVGPAAELEGLSADAPDAPVTGWNGSGGEQQQQQQEEEGVSYAFAYLSEQAPEVPVLKLLLRIVPLGQDVLITSLASDAESAQPQTLELPLDEYTLSQAGDGSSSSGQAGGAAAAAAAPAAAKCLKHLDQLAAAINSALAELTAAAGAGGGEGSAKKQRAAAATSAAAAAAAEQRQQQQQQQPKPRQPGPPDYDHDPLRIGPPRRPMRLGQEDIMPHLGGGGGIGGGMLPGGPSPLGGGGMHVGPGHPFFSDRMRHPDMMPGRGVGGPGIRWDPINPEGLQGWHPDDFTRGGGPGRGRGGVGGGRGFGGPPDLDPDLAQPGPGRGPDWDSMYG